MELLYIQLQPAVVFYSERTAELANGLNSALKISAVVIALQYLGQQILGVHLLGQDFELVGCDPA